MRIQKLTGDLLYMIRSMVTHDVYINLVNNESNVLCAWEMDRIKRKFEPIGALVYSSSSYSYDDNSNELLIESVFVVESFRRRGVGLELLNEMKKVAHETEGISGLCVNIPMPELKNEASLFLKNGFEHRIDGNIIYRINKSEINNIPFFDKIKKYKSRYKASSFNSVTNTELGKLYKMFDEGLPEWLNPATYGGVLQKDLSFLIIKEDKVEGFLAASLYPNGELYLGGIYVCNKDGLMVASLLEAFVNSLRVRADIKTIMFAAATKEGDDLIKHILKDYKSKYWVQVVSDYYIKLDK